MQSLRHNIHNVKRTDIALFLVFVVVAAWFIHGTILPRIFDVNSYSDFSVYYYSARAVREGVDVYDVQRVSQFAEGEISYWQDIGPYIYPPFYAIVNIPMTFFSYAQANAAWTIFLLLVLACLLYGVYKLSKDDVSPWLLFSAILLFFPLRKVFQLGQMELLITLGIFCSYLLYTRGRQIPAGIIIGLLGAIKLYPLFFLIFFLARKQHRLVIVAVVIFIVLALGSFLLVPGEYFGNYVREILPRFLGGESHIQLIEGGQSFAGTKYWPSNQSLSGFFAHTFTQNDVATGFIDNDVFARTATRVVTFAMCIVLLYHVFTKQKRNTDDALVFSFTIVTFLLINPLSWEQYYTLALIPFLLLFLRSRRQSNSFWVLLSLLFLYVVIALQINPWQESLRQGIGVLVLSHKAIAGTMLWSLIGYLLWKERVRE